MKPIPVIDLFAGPGGLAEGFASVTAEAGRKVFDVRLSIEKDPAAHQTLHLRSFFRSFDGKAPDEYYDYLRGKLTRTELLGNRRFKEHKEHADAEAQLFTLSEAEHARASELVRSALDGAKDWVLIGGPPCQAYSVVGRSRMRSSDPVKFEKDARHFLYREYLRIIADHAPTMFVMENVRGILSSTIKGRRIFEQIMKDLHQPGGCGARYRIVPVTRASDENDTEEDAFVIRSELYGIPQTRHRVILVGIREDVSGDINPLEFLGDPPNIRTALSGIPHLRSRLSREQDSEKSWLEALAEGATRAKKRGSRIPADIADAMETAVRNANRKHMTPGDKFLPYVAIQKKAASKNPKLCNWYFDTRLEGVSNHETRAHMRSDLHRYLFSAAYAQVLKHSPKLRHFPPHLLPNHQNVQENAADTAFDDRFRVQVYHLPATTILAHMAKDGHYFIHPDPSQCRSLTVREAARLQTFPDNYFFEGNRTEQYQQVGNAVPPLLAHQLGQLIYEFLAGRSEHRQKTNQAKATESARMVCVT